MLTRSPKTYPQNLYPCEDILKEIFEAGKTAQLEADQEKVRELFEEMKENFFTFDGDGNLILTSSPPRDRIVAWWQALEKEWLEGKMP